MTQLEDTYWMGIAVEDFCRRVWQRGLSKFALDKEVGDKEESFVFFDYSITVSRPSDDKLNVTIGQSLPSTPAIVVLFFFVENPSMPPEIAIWELEPSIELLEDVAEIWQENLFVKQ